MVIKIWKYWVKSKTDKSKGDIDYFGGIIIKWTDRDLSIVNQRRLMKAFAMIEFKRKWIMPSCSPTHLALE